MDDSYHIVGVLRCLHFSRPALMDPLRVRMGFRLVLRLSTLPDMMGLVYIPPVGLVFCLQIFNSKQSRMTPMYLVFPRVSV